MVLQAGHRIGHASVLDSNSTLPELAHPVDAWVVDLVEPHNIAADEKHQSIMLLLDQLLEQAQTPVIVNDGVEFHQDSIEHLDWVRRMLQRLERLSGDINLQSVSSANEVWVLGASTGGPAAVKEFLQNLAPDLNIALVYVQHIDTGQAETLIRMMTNAGHYPACIARQGTVLINNTLTLITADRSINIHENGTLVINKSPWSGFYSPSINQVAANIARVYRKHSGIIVFTGMGDDGAASCRLVKQQGGKVWIQTPEQCTIASMPEAALKTKSVSFSGTPIELAVALTRLKQPAIKKRK